MSWALTHIDSCRRCLSTYANRLGGRSIVALGATKAGGPMGGGGSGGRPVACEFMRLLLGKVRPAMSLWGPPLLPCSVSPEGLSVLLRLCPGDGET